ncbi:dephospho-CoA kinase [Herbiconiux sp. L3-i23]|uniref:dephospho-CoA kinase n=1 Tax=Herbiconiux sp. L3-i23 TaxID=2905871 RepID=UPI00204F5F42|nr:dephospho-CoA kinase [Herbiconiux sp. L3-i23]BDI22742.1 dephospho-CoA kinase [Herbiconiux sp. L3-i23]
MPLIALTGGIAAGKSTVAARLEALGAVIVDADVLSRVAVEPGSPGLEAIEREFGSAVIGPDGALDRPALGAIVFGDAAARERLNAIVHPEVGRLSQRAFADAFALNPAAVVVYDVPLLAEARGRREFDAVVVVHAPADVRIQRLVEKRGMTRDEAERRIGAQAGDDERLALADHVIDSSRTLAETIAEVDALWPVLRGTLRR